MKFSKKIFLTIFGIGVLSTLAISLIINFSVSQRLYYEFEEFEMKLINFALQKKGSESAAARYLGIPRSTLGDLRRRLQNIKK